MMARMGYAMLWALAVFGTWTLAGAAPANLCAGKWASAGLRTKFAEGPCLKISGIGVTQSPEKTIYVIDRSDLQNTVIVGPDGHLAYAEEINLVTGKQRGLSVRTNTFCSTGQFMPNGNFLSIGGDNPGGGGFSLREIRPGGDFKVVARMVSKRWYPTSLVMADGRIMVVGGTTVGVDMNRGQINNPTLEYYPKKPREGQYQVDFLFDALPYNLYPFAHLLPSGYVFIFANKGYILWDSRANQVAEIGPEIRAPGWSFSYPLTGTSVMFPLTPANGYRAEIMICGGGNVRAKPRQGVAGNPSQGAYGGCNRIFPEDTKPAWTFEKMSAPRVMPNAVLLPDSTVLIMNGARSGYAGIPNFARDPVYYADQYDTKGHRWVGRGFANSKVARLYHASAVLLHDATVFVSGSNPNSGILISKGYGTSQFRSEFFYPPYLAGGRFPSITRAPGQILTGDNEFDINVNAGGCKTIDVTLAYPGFSTHSANHGMRNVVLEVVNVAGRGPYTVTVKTPPNKNIAPPTFYWLFVLCNGVPNRDGHDIWVR